MRRWFGLFPKQPLQCRVGQGSDGADRMTATDEFSESLETREAGQAVGFVTAQVRASLPDTLKDRPFALAYEPIWAIGTGLTPTLDQIAEVHAAIRAALVERRHRDQGRRCFWKVR